MHPGVTSGHLLDAEGEQVGVAGKVLSQAAARRDRQRRRREEAEGDGRAGGRRGAAEEEFDRRDVERALERAERVGGGGAEAPDSEQGEGRGQAGADGRGRRGKERGRPQARVVDVGPRREVCGVERVGRRAGEGVVVVVRASTRRRLPRRGGRAGTLGASRRARRRRMRPTPRTCEEAV